MNNQENTLVYTVSTIGYLEQAVLALKSVKNNNKFNIYFIFIVDIKKESYEIINRKIKKNYPWIELLATHQLKKASKNIMNRAYKVFSKLEICSLSKFICLKYLTNKYLSTKYFVYIDTDLYFFSSLKNCLNSIKNKPFLVTPHYLNPYDPFKESNFLTSGYINSGFYIAQPSCQNFQKILDILIERISKLGFLAPELGLYCDQNWVNLISHVFTDEFCLFKDPGCNIAYWNIENRLISKKGGHYYANNHKLIFFHFSGFSKNLNKRLSLHSNYAIKENSLMDEIINIYKVELRKISIDTTNLDIYNLKDKSLKKRISLMEKEINFKLFEDNLNHSLFLKVLRKINQRSIKVYKAAKRIF